MPWPYRTGKEQLGIQLSLLAQKKEVAAAEAELQALNEGESETNPSIVDEELVQKGTAQYILNKKRRNATKPGFQRFNQVLIWQE